MRPMYLYLKVISLQLLAKTQMSLYLIVIFPVHLYYTFTFMMFLNLPFAFLDRYF